MIAAAACGRIVRIVGSLVMAMAMATAMPGRAAAAPVPGDRWMEIDLYWFDPVNVSASVDRFWERYAPLYRDVRGYKGVVLSVGLTANFILTYSGDPGQRIDLPDTSGQEIGHAIAGQLEGDTAERQRAWRRRFTAEASAPPSIAYGRWTYADLRRLTDAMRARARREGIADFRVAVFVVGGDGAYGDQMQFARRHPEAFTLWPAQAEGALASSSNLDPSNPLRADPTPMGGFPKGIPQGLPVHAFFAAQWAAVSKTSGLDGIMLRDSMSFPRAYTRYGPSGTYVPDVATAERNTTGLAALIRGIKRANPQTLVMMYSTAATATSDWRANGIDVEQIAREGYLDIFVDQSWAGAWGEVGVREQTFWNAPILGWTYQLGYMLQHAAALAGSKVRHYPLIETFDAWESWDTIHTARDRLRWGIWAYSHAGVKTPRGLRMPAGNYISWANHGRDLLTADDVAFLRSELNAAALDAAQTVDIAGPTIVYSRDAAAGQLSRLAPGFDPRDRIDEQVGTIIKWPLPILSATRAEWVAGVKSDLFLFGITTDLPSDQLRTIKRLAGAGQPMAFFGSVASGTHADLAAMIGISSIPHRPSIQDRNLRGTVGPALPSGFAGPTAFDAPPPATQVIGPPSSVVYRFGNVAGLLLDRRGGRSVTLWDPVPISDEWYRPLRDLLNGDPTPFTLTAATLNDQLVAAGALGAVDLAPAQSGTVGAWRLRDGGVRILAGNLEEGLNDGADRSRTISLKLPPPMRSCGWRGSVQSDGSSFEVRSDQMRIKLPPQASVMLKCG